MAGFQQLKVTKKADFTGATVLGAGWPITKGKVLFVDTRSWGNGATGRDGTDPNYPLSTLTEAYGKCTSGNGDYIFVLDGYDNDTTTITIAKTNLHIIGLSNGNHAAPFPWLLFNSGAASPFTLQGGNSANVEIAGFTLGGNASNACITTATGGSTELVYGHIHHCGFAATGDAAFVAQDGILEAASTGLDYTLIEDCVFGKQLTRDGIRFLNFYGGLIRNNIFRMTSYMGVRQLGTGGATTGTPDIIGNKFFQKTPALDKGSSIYITNSGGGFIDDNHTAENADGACDNNPYVDLSNGTADTTTNAWGVNWAGYAVAVPAVT